MKPLVICLTQPESRICYWVGRQRAKNATEESRDPGLGGEASWENRHIRGAHCEWAASIALNLYWRASVGRIRDRDVGGVVEVRSGTEGHHCLIIKPKDIEESPSTPFVLVIAYMDALRFELRGWQVAGEAPRLAELRKDRGDPAHFVKQGDLLDLELLSRRLGR